MTTETKPDAKASCCGLEVEEHQPDSGSDLPQIAAVFKALSDETRLRIVRAMAHARAELCECNIVPLFGLSQPTISYHLKVLREAGLVECEKRGQWLYCRVNSRALMAAVKALADIG